MASLAPIAFATPEPRTIVSRDPADLAWIYEPEVNLCILERDIDPAVQRFTNTLLTQREALEIEQAIQGERLRIPETLKPLPHSAAWADDVNYLLDLFRDLFAAGRIGFRTHILDKAMCPRFHVDRVPVRLICTYGGCGTEWLPEYAVDRSKLGPGACGLPDETSGIIRDPAAIQRLPAYAVGLLKGEKWEGNEGRGAVHRSPKPGGDRPKRLPMTLDWL
jgi:hypothetical protein